MAKKQSSISGAFGALSEDRSLTFIIYLLYLLALPIVTIWTVLIGLVLAYVNRDGAGPRARSHYIFQIRTFWTAIAWWIIGGASIGLGLLLSPVLIGIPLALFGCLIFGVGHLWFGIRCLAGLVYLVRDEAYPRPRSWLF